ncbi:MAG: T9SS C-terminal target domain-containing protein, partial [Bacteroidetes bacterium]
YVPRGAGWFARTISFQMNNADDIANYQNNTANVLLYEWQGDLNRNSLVEPEEYTTRGVAEYTFDGTETGLITVPITDIFDDAAIPLEDDRYYMAVIQFVAAQEGDTYFMTAAEDTYPYGATVFISDSLSVTGELPATYYGNVLEVGNPDGADVTFSTVGFGRNIVPIVEMSIGLNGNLSLDPLVSTKDALPDDYVIETFPNPATTHFTLNMEMPDMQDVTVIVYDLKGQTLFTQKYNDLQTGNFRYDTADLPAGMYFVRVSTEAGSRTLKVSVQR